MKMIKWASDIMAGNLDEAQKYIGKAYELRDTNPTAADWCKDMAVKHLDFNKAGHELVKKLITDFQAGGKHSDLAPGMMAVYNDRHADLIRKAAEITGMIAAYK